MPRIDLFGSHPREFLAHLEAAGYSLAEHAAYTTYTLQHDQPPAAVAVHGGDAALESPEAIAQLLKTETILVLFAPSPALLNAAKNATRSILGLTDFKLINGNALIVHKIQGLDQYHFILGVSLPRRDSEATSDAPVPSESALLRASVDLIGEAISNASDPEVLRELAPLNDNFLPPPGTNYCKNEIITVSSVGYLRWTLHVYIYVANVNPSDPDWKAKGGQVFTLVRHSGYFEIIGNLWIDFGMTGVLGDVKVNDHRPMKYDQKVDGDYIYRINYGRPFNLFRDRGQTMFQHNVTYTDAWRITEVEQLPYPGEINFDGFQYELRETVIMKTSIHALSVFTSDLTHTEFHYKCPWMHTYGIITFNPKDFP